MNVRKNILVACSIMFALFVIMTGTAFATSATGLPWESALTKVEKSVTGPVAMTVSLVAIVAVGVTLIFGGDMQGFVRQLLYVALVVGLIVMASTVLKTLYNKEVSSAYIVVENIFSHLFLG